MPKDVGKTRSIFRYIETLIFRCIETFDTISSTSTCSCRAQLSQNCYMLQSLLSIRTELGALCLPCREQGPE